MVAKLSYYIEAPVATVFEYFKDPNLTRDLVRFDLNDVHVTKDGVGTFSTWSFKVAGLRVEGLEVLTDVVPDKHITERSSMAQTTWEYDFAPEGTGTRVTMTVRPGSLWRLPPFDRVFDLAFPRMSRAVMPKFITAIEAAAKERPKAVPTKPRKTAAAR